MATFSNYAKFPLSTKRPGQTRATTGLTLDPAVTQAFKHLSLAWETGGGVMGLVLPKGTQAQVQALGSIEYMAICPIHRGLRGQNLPGILTRAERLRKVGPWASERTVLVGMYPGKGLETIWHLKGLFLDGCAPVVLSQ